MTSLGWRKPVPCRLVADAAAARGRDNAVGKSDALIAVKRVAAHIGLKSGDLMLLDALCAFTKPLDWQKGARPVVWPSNRFLMEHTGFSRSALKRHGNRLAEQGLICFKDSSNGKRWGHRDTSGRIVEAYGFDLAPMAGRIDEFAALYRELCEERALCRSLRRKITIARRTIRAMLEAASGSLAQVCRRQLWPMFQALLSRIPSGRADSTLLLNLHESFMALRDRTETAVADRRRSSDAPDGAAAGRSLEPFKAPISVSQPSASDPASAPLEAHLDISTILDACPGFVEYAEGVGGSVRAWSDLRNAAGKIRPMVGISPDGWETALTALGPDQAAAALALIVDKYDRGEVHSPGGYLRGLVAKAATGELHLVRSFRGRLAILREA